MELLTTEELKGIYHKLFKTHRFIGTQPTTFNETRYKPHLHYYLTPKLNGQRYLLLVVNKVSYLINTKMEFFPYFEFKIGSSGSNKSSKKLSNKNVSVFDGELYEGKFHIFDVIVYKGEKVHQLKFHNRLRIMGKMNLPPEFVKKHYYSPYPHKKKSGSKSSKPKNFVCKNFFTIKKKFASKMRKGDVDGIIFVSDNSYFKSSLLKWKSRITIDFKIKKLSGNKIQLLLQNDQPLDEYPNTIKLTSYKYKSLNNGDVIECGFNKTRNEFYMIQTRPDKVTSNATFVIKNNMNAILNPINMYSLLLCEQKVT